MVQTATYTVAATIDLVICNHASTTIAVNLPVAAATGRKIQVKNINHATVEVTPDGTDTIDGVNSPLMLGKNESVTVVDYVANKWVVLYS